MQTWPPEVSVWAATVTVLAAAISLTLFLWAILQWVAMRRKLSRPEKQELVLRQALLLVWTREAVRSLQAIVSHGNEQLTEAGFARYFEYVMLGYLRILFDRAWPGAPYSIGDSIPATLFRGEFYVVRARACFLVPTADGKSLRKLAGCAPANELYGDSTLPVSGSVAGQSLLERRLLIWPTDDQIHKYCKPVTSESPFKTFACLPVPSSDWGQGEVQARGVLCVDVKQENALVASEIVIWLSHIADVVIAPAVDQLLVPPGVAGPEKGD